MKRGTCQVAELTAVGEAGRGFESVGTASDKDLDKVSESANGAKAGSLRSVAELRSIDTYWSSTFATQGGCLSSVGDRLKSTAGIYSHADKAAEDLFDHVPPPAGTWPR